MSRVTLGGWKLAVIALLGGCASPVHLGYDHGRAYQAAFLAQTDLTRTSVPNGYMLYGIEGVKIRINVAEKVSEEKSGTSTLGGP
jgi:hypothetical protein